MVLLRKGEAEEVMNTFKENMNLNVIKSDSEEVFLRHLKGVADPEQKRKIIGRTFIDVFDAEATKLKGRSFFSSRNLFIQM
jgi:GMP synthase (glutamine-hydrolysing)